MRILPVVTIIVIHAWLNAATIVTQIWYDTLGTATLESSINAYTQAFFGETGTWEFRLTINPVDLVRPLYQLFEGFIELMSLEIHSQLFTGNWRILFRILQLISTVTLVTFIWNWIPILIGQVIRAITSFIPGLR